MTIDKAMETYKLPNPCTSEDLQTYWNIRAVLRFGDKVLLAGYYYLAGHLPEYYGAVYEWLTDDHSCEGEIGLRAVSKTEFWDEGHAIAWAMVQ